VAVGLDGSNAMSRFVACDAMAAVGYSGCNVEQCVAAAAAVLSGQSFLQSCLFIVLPDRLPSLVTSQRYFVGMGGGG
jgi:hypothetical protein